MGLSFGSIIGGAMPVLGGALGGLPGAAIGAGVGNIIMQDQTNQANQRMSENQMEFQKWMSNTAHQREVKDLQAAGLNPTLSAGGNGASTPSGASAQMVAPQIDFPGLMKVKELQQADERIGIEKANSAATIAKNLSDQDLNRMKKVLMQKGLIRAETEGEVYEVLKKGFRNFKNSFNSSRPPSGSKMEQLLLNPQQ